MSVNKVLLLGRIGQEPELKTTPTGQSVCNFSLATSERWSKDGQKQERTTWHSIVVWGKNAENCAKFLSKGSEVFVEGKIQVRDYEKDGVKRYVTEIVADGVNFISGNSDKNSALKQAHDANDSGTHQVSTNADFSSDDLPF